MTESVQEINSGKKTHLLWRLHRPFHTERATFYQDTLGTNTVKAPKEMRGTHCFGRRGVAAEVSGLAGQAVVAIDDELLLIPACV
eukprot:COSAG06_NODE_2771_length_6311_cov_12.386671_3_plen_85_part_00